MPKTPLPSDVLTFLRAPNPCVIASNRPDGQPVSVATWYLLEDDGRILVNMDSSRRRLSYLSEDPRVTLTMLDKDDWYTHVSVQGRITDLGPDPDLVGIDRLSTHYLGNPYGVRDRERVNGWVVVDSWHGWQHGKAVTQDLPATTTS